MQIYTFSPVHLSGSTTVTSFPSFVTQWSVNCPNFADLAYHCVTKEAKGVTVVLQHAKKELFGVQAAIIFIHLFPTSCISGEM